MVEEARKFPGYDDPDVLGEPDEPEVKKSCVELVREKIDQYSDKVNFYATVFFSLLAIGAFFAFLFLVPFVIEPAVTTIQMDFALDPVTCCVVAYRKDSGSENCSDWSSCREGCTREVYECDKVWVAYTDAKNFSCSRRPANHQWLYNEANLYPNVKGCGYPPSLNCTAFAQTYRVVNTTFPCYYSRVDATLVITTLDPDEIEANLAISIVVPLVCFAGSIAFLVHAYHRMKRKEAAAAVADALAEEKALRLLAEEGEEEAAEPTTSRSNPNSSYSLKSITSKINSTVVRFARDRRHDSGSVSLLSVGNNCSEEEEEEDGAVTQTNC
ncbi:protein tipE-like isoform X1 [Pollicipes pollicipes]|uniref:protein tipE-like isoform X1 n=1 Tax=Pollicipes pollicipes TaxID=41117 RepID=UPI0018855D9C|nr:protein tipE-like isoform X1 [Pollicipes pollicipes]